jgi:hypothetical protein
MVFRRADAAAPRRAQHRRAGQAAARARAHARGVAGDVVDHRIDEAFELRLGDRLHALRGQADGEAGDRRLVQRRVDHALGAELLLQARGGAEHAAVDADVLAEHDDDGSRAHLVGERLGDGFDQGDRGRRGRGVRGLRAPSVLSASARCSGAARRASAAAVAQQSGGGSA